ncbi:MAG: glycosyltransferase family 4 protein [Chitinophagaceae bacterium]|nr:glycosyltransferase family 4 protein [Chitinophagaceae bacterium]
MNILILNSASLIYGSTKILITVVQEFRKKGHHVLVVVSEPGPLVDELEKMGIETKIIRLGIIRRKYVSVPGIFNRIWVMTKAFFALRKLVRQQKTDLIFSNTTAVLIGAIVARASGKRHIWHIHETIMKPVIICRIIAWLIRHCTEKAIVVSETVLQHWMRYVKDASKFALIYNGIDTAPFANKESAFRAEYGIGNGELLIGVIGMIHYLKGQDYFLQIAGIIAKEHPDARFVIVGDAFPGYEYLFKKLETLAAEENIQDRVIYTGYRTDIINVLNALDILVLPSVLPDSFPTVILEAMAAAKPVVATRQGGAIEMIIPGVTGLLIPIADPAAAAAEMQQLLRNGNLRAEMGMRARKHLAEAFSFESFSNKITSAI